MSEFIALQIVRTPQARKMNIDLQKALFEELLKRSSDSPTDAYYVEFNESFASIEHAQLMFDPQLQLGLGHAIANHIWLFGKNISSQQFYISDTPVVRRSHLQPPLMGAGFGSYGLEVAFPLTPEFVLIMCDRRAFFPLARLDESIIDLKSDHITYYNAMQVLESYRSLYCSLGEFLLAADISNAFPGTSDPEHIRVQ